MTQLAAIEPDLKRALQEVPPPSLLTMSKRLGFSATHLRRRAPILCQELMARQQPYAAQRNADLENNLMAALGETPPPSLSSVYTRLGTSGWIVSTNFPSLRVAIAERYRQYRKQEIQASRDAVRQETRQVVGNLHEQGPCPSVPV